MYWGTLGRMCFLDLALPNGISKTSECLCSSANSNFGDRLLVLLITDGPRSLDAGLPGNCGAAWTKGSHISTIDNRNGRTTFGFCWHETGMRSVQEPYTMNTATAVMTIMRRRSVTVMHWREGDLPKCILPPLTNSMMSLALSWSAF